MKNDMNGGRLPFVFVFGVLLISSLVIYQRSNALSSFKLENQQLVDEMDIQYLEIQTLKNEISDLTSTIKSINETLISVLELSAMENEMGKKTFVSVIKPRKKITYTFEASMNYSYTVNYSFPQSTNVVFSILGSDMRTVVGYTELDLIGQGTYTVNIEIPLPQTPMNWVVYPSAYWLEDETPKYIPQEWNQEAIITIVDGTPGHTQSSCSSESAICHSG